MEPYYTGIVHVPEPVGGLKGAELRTAFSKCFIIKLSMTGLEGLHTANPQVVGKTLLNM